MEVKIETRETVRLRGWRAWAAMFFTVFLMVFILILVLTILLTSLSTPIFASTARIGIDRTMTGKPGDSDLSSDSAVIESPAILDRVIETLNLNAEWAKKYGISSLKPSESRALLKRSIELRPNRNMSLLNITVYSANKQEAPKIANTIAQTYRDYRIEQREKLLAGSRDEYQKLTDELKNELADKTNDAKMVDAKITDIIARSGQLYLAINGEIQTERVEIIEAAEPALRPVRPNMPLNIALGIIGGGFGGVIAGALVVILGIVFRNPARPAS